MRKLKIEKECRVVLNNVNAIFHSSFYIEERVSIFYFLASSLRPMLSPHGIRRQSEARAIGYRARLLLSATMSNREHVPRKNSHDKRAERPFIMGKCDFVWAGRPSKTRRSTAANRRALRTTRPFKTPVLAH